MKYNFKRNELDAIIELARQKSYSVAAKKLNIAQANLSRTISNIEDKIGLKIFERDTRPIKTTRFGERLLPLIIKNLDAIEELSLFTEVYKKHLGGQINICAPASILFFFTRFLLSEIKKNVPELNINLITYNNGGTIYKNGIEIMDDADITFTYSSPVNEALIAKKVATLRFNIYCNKDKMNDVKISKIEDYEKYPCILMPGEESGYNEWFFVSSESKSTIQTKVTGEYTADNYITALELARQTGHLVMAPRLLIKEMNLDYLFPTLPEKNQCFGDIYMVFKQKSYLPYRICVLTELIMKIMSSLQ
ncbi:LysR family transcriptional regulator [Enterobacter asburiae]|nr:LysR family transcriptional regulator [Enterobacter asburiae]